MRGGTGQAVIAAPLEVQGRKVQRHPSLSLEQPLCELLHHHLTWSLQFGRSQQEATQHRVNTTYSGEGEEETHTLGKLQIKL